MYLFDTNIFLEFLLGQRWADDCEGALEKLAENKMGWATSFSLHAIAAILSSNKHDKELSKFLQFFRGHPYLFCYSTTLDEEIEIARLSQKVGLDFDDCLQFYVAKKQDLTLVTLDRDFGKIKDIKVIMPGLVG